MNKGRPTQSLDPTRGGRQQWQRENGPGRARFCDLDICPLCVAWGSSKRLYGHNHCRWELLFQTPFSLKNFLKASGARQTFFAEKKIKNKLRPLECLPSISPSAGYGTCTWYWLWPRKAQGNWNSQKSSNTSHHVRSFSRTYAATRKCAWKSICLWYKTFLLSHISLGFKHKFSLVAIGSQLCPHPYYYNGCWLLPLCLFPLLSLIFLAHL